MVFIMSELASFTFVFGGHSAVVGRPMVRSLFVDGGGCCFNTLLASLRASAYTDELSLLHLVLKFLTSEVIWEEDVAIKGDQIVLLPNFLFLLASETEAASKSESAQVLHFDIKD